MNNRKEQRRTRWIALAVLLCGAISLCFLVMRPFIGPLIYGLIAATLSYPLHRRIAARLSRPSLAPLLTSTIVLLAFAAPMAFVISIVVHELRSGLEAMGPQSVAESADRLLLALDGPLQRAAGWLGTDSAALRKTITERVGAEGAALARQAIGFVGATTAGIIHGIVAPMTLYFALRDGSAVYARMLLYSPLGAAQTARIANAARGMMFASFYGIVAVATAQGLLCGLGAWIAGLPAPALWGLATAICSVIPLVGSALVWVPAAIVLFAQGSIGYGIFMLAWGGVVIANIDNIVRPWVMVAQVSVNGLMIFIALLGGMQAFGLVGIFIGPVILAVTLELFALLREELERPAESAPDLR